MKRILIASALLVMSCGRGESETIEAPVSHDEEREYTTVFGASAEAAPCRVTRWSGDVTRLRGALEVDGSLEQGELLIVPDGGDATLDLRDGGRIELRGESAIQIGDGGPAQVELIYGDMRATMPPGPSGPRPPLRLATPSASVELEGAGDVWIRSLRSGATWVVALSGLSSVSNGEADVRRRLRSVELTRGHAVLVTSRLGDVTPGPDDVIAARIIAATLFESSDNLGTERSNREIAENVSRLDESLGWLETETRRGLELTAQHREAVRANHEPEAMRLQRDLANHAQRLHSLREVATARWERLATGTLLAQRSGPLTDDPAAARRDRVSSLLGL